VAVEGLKNARVNIYGSILGVGTRSVFSVVGTGTAGSPGGIACFGCPATAPATASSSSDGYHVSNEGNLVAFGGWFQAGATPAVVANLIGESGKLALLGGTAQVNAAAGQPLINLDNFQGNLTVASYQLEPGALRIANASSLSNTLVAGC